VLRECLFSILLFAFATAPATLSADLAPPGPGRVKEPVCVPVHYADQAVVIYTARGVAAVRFTDAIPQGRKYVYRFRAARAGADEERGEGKVFEKYDRKPLKPPAQGDEVVDAGGRLRVVAGKIEITWSLGSEDVGYLYFAPEDERVQIVSADEFRKLDLSRFSRPATAPALLPATTQPVSTTQPTARENDRLDVLEAVFRHQFGHNGSAGQQKVDYYFLSLDKNADPPAELLARFKGESPKVFPISFAKASPGQWVKHKDLGGRGLVFRITSIAWLDEDTAEVKGGYYEAVLSASGNTYTVTRKNGVWRVTDDEMNWIS